MLSCCDLRFDLSFRWRRRSGCARSRPSQSGTGTSWHTRSTWNQRLRSKHTTSNSTSHWAAPLSCIMTRRLSKGWAGFTSQEISQRQELKQSLYASSQTRLLNMLYCISISVSTALHRATPNPLRPLHLRLHSDWLIHLKHLRAFWNAFHCDVLIEKFYFFQMFCFIPSCMQQLLWYLKVDLLFLFYFFPPSV